MKYSVEELPKGSRWKYKITLVKTPNKFLKFLGFKEIRDVYVGTPTVFFHYPSGARCDTFKEYDFCGLVERYEMSKINLK